MNIVIVVRNTGKERDCKPLLAFISAVAQHGIPFPAYSIAIMKKYTERVNNSVPLLVFISESEGEIKAHIATMGIITINNYAENCGKEATDNEMPPAVISENANKQNTPFAPMGIIVVKSEKQPEEKSNPDSVAIYHAISYSAILAALYPPQSYPRG